MLPSGAFRFDIFAGVFDKNDMLTVSPRTNAFLFIENITLNDAQSVLNILNGEGSPERRGLILEREEDLYSRGFVDMRYQTWLREMSAHEMYERQEAQNLTLGYVTKDVCIRRLPVESKFIIDIVVLNLLVLSWRWRRHTTYSPAVL
jgi:hypothetical protein